MLSELLFLACGMYIGKYYPEYIPFPRITQAHIDAALAYLKAQSPQTTAPAAQELKHE